MKAILTQNKLGPNHCIGSREQIRSRHISRMGYRPSLTIVPTPVATVDTHDEDGEARPQRRDVKMPSWAQLDAFLEQQAKILIHSENSSVNEPRDNSANRSNQNKPRLQSASAINVNAKRQKKCPLCSDEHYIHTCKIWKDEMNLLSRKAFVQEKNLCHVCLKPFHGSSNCYGAKKNIPCPKCPNRRFHNSTLCPTGEANRQAAALSLEVGTVQAHTGAISKKKV